PLSAFLDSVIGRVAEPFARVTDVSAADAAAWAAGAVGFVRGAGEWWLAHRDRPDVPDREQLTERVAAWLWAGPVGVLSHSPAARAPDDRRAPTGARRDAARPDLDRPLHRAATSDLKETSCPPRPIVPPSRSARRAPATRRRRPRPASTSSPCRRSSSAA